MASQRRMRFLKEREQAQRETIAKAKAWVAEMDRMRAPQWAKTQAQVALAKALEPQPDVRCRAMAKGTGRRCRNVAEPDHWVCSSMAGAARAREQKWGRRGRSPRCKPDTGNGDRGSGDDHDDFFERITRAREVGYDDLRHPKGVRRSTMTS